MSLMEKILDTKLAGMLLHSIHAGDKTLAENKEGVGARIEIASESFGFNQPIPPRYAGPTGVSPSIRWDQIPAGTKELVLLCEDPDAPASKPYVHWVLYGIPPAVRSLMEGVSTADEKLPSGIVQGKNSRDERMYTGPQPPPGHGVHHYHFQLFALDTELPRGALLDRDQLLDEMKGHVIGYGDFVGTFERN